MLHTVWLHETNPLTMLPLQNQQKTQNSALVNDELQYRNGIYILDSLYLNGASRCGEPRTVPSNVRTLRNRSHRVANKSYDCWHCTPCCPPSSSESYSLSATDAPPLPKCRRSAKSM
jgi:hypothetical protein